MDNENEFNYSADNNFKQVPKKKKLGGFGKNVVLPFVSGIVGASLVVGVCFGVPSIKNNILNLVSTNSETSNSSSNNKTYSLKDNSEYSAKLMDLAEYSETAVAVAEIALPNVVGITVTYNVSTFGGQTTATATGSGVIISDDGYIITNNHVIDSSSSSSAFYQITSANSIKVHLYGDADDVLYDAKIVGNDSETDLAVLKIDVENLDSIVVGDSENLRVGEFVMAVGNPLGLDSSVTCGVISALDREVDDGEGNKFLTIQTDAAINSGNSGGALINSKGELIGINSMKLSGDGIEGIGFAIPINSAMDTIDELIEYGSIRKPYIGIAGRNITEELAKEYDYPVGVYVQEVYKDTPASEAELQSGDVITEINGTKIKTMDELNNNKNKCEIGDEITLKIYRDGKYKDYKLTLVETPTEEKEGTSDTDSSENGSLQEYFDNYDKFYNNGKSNGSYYYFNPFAY